MLKFGFFRSRSVLALLTSLIGFALPAAAATEARLSESYGKLPLAFEANQGQALPRPSASPARRSPGSG
jgi:hypothetical protein